MYPPPWIQRTPGAGPSASFGARTLAFILPACVPILTVRDGTVLPLDRNDRIRRRRVNNIFTVTFSDACIHKNNA